MALSYKPQPMLTLCPPPTLKLVSCTYHKVQVPPGPQALLIQQVQFVKVRVQLGDGLEAVVDVHVRGGKHASEIGRRAERR